MKINLVVELFKQILGMFLNGLKTTVLAKKKIAEYRFLFSACKVKKYVGFHYFSGYMYIFRFYLLGYRYISLNFLVKS